MQVNATEAKLVQVIEFVMARTDGKLMINLADAGKLGICFNLKV